MTTTVPSIIHVTGIQINESINSIEVGESKKLTATIIPYNATDKNIIWKSSDESIATISSSGEVVAKKSGTINITASTSNGKTSTIKRRTRIENNVITNNLATNKNNTTTNNTTTNRQDDSNLLGGILTLGILGVCGYWGYKKYNEKRFD